MAEKNQIVPTDTAYSSELVLQIIKKLTTKYPWIRIKEIGKSVLGRPIEALVIGEGRMKVCYNAAFHANEWITTPVLLKFAEEYAAAVDQGREIYGVDADWVYRTFQLTLIPLVNPDGVDLVNGMLEGQALFRAEEIAKQYPNISFPSGWKANIEGIDLNLQFPAGWEMAVKNKAALGFTSPAPRDFPGYEPLSAPESIAMYNFTREQEFSLILAYHTQGEVIYWRYLNNNPPGARRIGEYFREVSGYALEVTPMASGFAGYKDWFIKEYNRPGYTIEAGLGTNPLPIEQFDEIYDANIGILAGGMVQLLV